MKALLIPVKRPDGAKTRLSDLLSAEERQNLAWSMFEDVAKAARDATVPDRVVLVSSYSPAIDHAQMLGWDVIRETEQFSESASVDYASRVLSERGFDIVMRLPADLPLVRAADIDDILSTELSGTAALLVPSREGTGTNAIVRTPPLIFPSRFGPNSLSLHKSEALQVGIECIVVENAHIALDIDEPMDIEFLLDSGVSSGTVTLLQEMQIADRLAAFHRTVQQTSFSR